MSEREFVDEAFYWVRLDSATGWEVAQFTSGYFPGTGAFIRPGYESSYDPSSFDEIGSCLGKEPPGAEREAIVRWLRSDENPWPDASDIADELERGEHLKPAEDTEKSRLSSTPESADFSGRCDLDPSKAQDDFGRRG